MIAARSLSVAVLIVGLAQSAWAGATQIKDIDIIVKKIPTGKALTVSPDSAGRVRFDISEAGSYRIEGSLSTDFFTTCSPPAVRVGKECFPPDGITLKGRFAGSSDPTATLVTGKYVDGNVLIAAGNIRPDGSVFSVDLTVLAPVSFVGTVTADDGIGINANHLTFYAVTGGKQPPAQALRISNHSTSTVSYTAAFEPVGPNRWSLTLSQSSGTIIAGQSDSIDVQPPVLPEECYNGFLRVKMLTPTGTQEQVAAVTLFVQPEASSKATLLLDRPMQIVYPRSDGSYDAAAFKLTNNGAKKRTFETRSADGVTLQPARLTLAPGETGSVGAAMPRAPGLVGHRMFCTTTYAVSDDGSIDFLNQPSGYPKRECFVAVDPAALTTACTPTSLQPIISGMNPPVPRLGYPIDVTVQVYDNCGNIVDNFTAAMSFNNGSQSALSAVQHSKAIDKKGANGFSARPRESARPLASFADSATELELHGHVYPYFTIGQAGLNLKVDVETDAATGGVLTGSVEMPLVYDADSSAPLVTQGAFVPSTYEAVPLAINDIFLLFTVLPGFHNADAQVVPLPTSLGDLEVRIDGNANVPLIYAHNGAVAGIVPVDLSDGEHIVNILYQDTMTGALPFQVARANPAVMVFGQNNAHLYHADGQLVTQTNPGVAGEVLSFYAVGMGDVEGTQLVSGAATPVKLLPAKLNCHITIGDNPIDIQYCGMSPGTVMLYQANFVLPSITLPGGAIGDVAQMSITLDQDGHAGSRQALSWFKGNTTQSQVKLYFGTVPANLSYKVNTTNFSQASGPLNFNVGQSVSVDVPQLTQPTTYTDTRYIFHAWSTPLNQTPAAQSFTVPSTPLGQITAYFDTQYKLTLIGSFGSLTSGTFYTVDVLTGAKQSVKLNGACPAGLAATGLLVQNGDDPSITLPNGSTIVMDAPKTVTVQCSPRIAQAPSCVAAPSGLIGWWPLDELNGTVARNLGSLAVNGTYTNNPISVPAGKVAGAYDFSNGGTVVINSATAYDFPASANRGLTIDAWVRGDELARGIHHLVGKHDNGTKGGYFLSLWDGRLTLHLHDVNHAQRDFKEPVPTHAAVSDGNWHLVAATVDFAANQGALYFDGVQVLAFTPDHYGKPFGDIITPPALKIGWDPFPGQIDEVEIFNRALSLAEIDGIFAASSFGKCKTFTATVSGCSGAGIQIGGGVVPGGAFPPGTTLTVVGTTPSGGLANVSVTMNGVTTVYTSLPVSFPLTGDAKIVVNCVTKPTACVAAPTGMVGWYPLDESTGPNYADIAANPAPVSGLAGANPGKVLGSQFISNQLATAGSPAKYNFGQGDFSIDFWTHVLGTNGTFISKTTTSGNPQGFSLGLQNGQLRLLIGDGSSANASSWTGTKLIPGSTFQHVVVTVSRSSGVMFYVNGVVDTISGPASVPSGSISNTEPLRFGSLTELYLDEVEIFNRVLTATEAQTLFLADSLGKCKTGPCPDAPTDSAASYALESATDPIVDQKNGLNGSVETILFLSNYTPGGTLKSVAGKSGNGVLFPNKVTPSGSFPLSPAVILLPNSTKFDSINNGLTVFSYVKLDPGQDVTAELTIFGRHGNSRSKVVSGSPANANYSLQLYSIDSNGNRIPQGPAPAGTRAQLEFFIDDGLQPGNGYYPWVSNLTFNFDSQWHCVGISVQRTTGGGANLTFFVDGKTQTISIHDLGPLDTNGTTWLGWNGFTPSNYDTHFIGSLDEVQFFARDLSASELNGLCNCGSTQPTTTFPVTVNTNPPNIGATVGLTPSTPGTATNVYFATVAAGNYAVTVAPTTITNGAGDTQYRFKTANSWSLNGTPNPVWTNASQPVNIAAAGTYTANFDTYYKVAINLNGCLNQNTVGIPASGGSTFVLAGSSFNTSIAAPSGTSIQTATLNGVPQQPGGNGNVVINVNPVNGPVTVATSCTANVNITVETNPKPLPIGLAFTLAGSSSIAGSYTNSKTYSAAPNAIGYSHATTSPQVVNGIQYTFQNWTPSPSGNPTSLVQTIPNIPASPITYTANFTVTGYVVTVVDNCGSANVGPASLAISTNPLIFPPGSSLVASGTAGSGQVFQNIVVSSGGGGAPVTYTTNPANIGALNGPITVTVNCATAPGINITVQTNPQPSPTGLSFTLAGNTSVNGTYTNSRTYTAPQNATGFSHATTSPQVVNGTQYTFQNWTPSPSGNPTSLAQTIPNIPASSTTYTANFQVTGYVVTVVNNCGSANVGPASLAISTNPLIFPPGSSLVASGTAGSGQAFQNIVVSFGGGGAPVTFTTNPANIGALNGPITVTVNCGQATTVTHTVTTNPTGQALKVQIDSGALQTAPQSAAWLPGSAHTLTSPSPQVNTGGDTQYSLTGWTSTASVTSGGSVAAAPSTPATYTANFQVSGYKLTVGMSTNGCATYTPNPAVPASGFYAPSTVVLLAVSAASGYAISSVTGATFANGVYSVTMSAPQTVTINCLANATVLASLGNGSVGGNIILSLNNTSANTAVNLTITGISVNTPNPNGIVWDQGVVGAPNLTLPWVLGNLSDNTGTARNLGFKATSGTINAAFSFTVTYKADNMAPVSTVINVPFPR